jgi:hypothetical protein
MDAVPSQSYRPRGQRASPVVIKSSNGLFLNAISSKFPWVTARRVTRRRCRCCSCRCSSLSLLSLASSLSSTPPPPFSHCRRECRTVAIVSTTWASASPVVIKSRNDPFLNAISAKFLWVRPSATTRNATGTREHLPIALANIASRGGVASSSRRRLPVLYLPGQCLKVGRDMAQGMILLFVIGRLDRGHEHCLGQRRRRGGVVCCVV